MNFKFGFLFFFCVLRVRVYPLLAAGWASNSKYSLLGCLRGIAQTISYEVSLVLTILRGLLLVESFELGLFEVFQRHV